MNIPLGFRFASTYAGIRKQQKDDLALIVPDKSAAAAAVFTTNVVQAAPVRLARKHLKKSKHRVAAVLINAGNANCATRTGDEVAMACCQAVAKNLKVGSKFVFPASTGVIGVEMDANLVTGAMPELVKQLSNDKFEQVAQAIMTTDTRMKIAGEELHFGEGAVRVAGMTKGSGMIHPHMATTLAFVMTDAHLDSVDLEEILEQATNRSFNSLTVDGDMSTNDTLLLMASGAADVKLSRKEKGSVGRAIARVLESLAKQIAADGEGARKLITVEVQGFKNDSDAKTVARAIANSPLVKTAVAGSDPNWGRILTAAGYSSVDFNPEHIDIELQHVRVCKSGLAAEYDEAVLKQKLDLPEVEIRVNHAKHGKGRARFFTCDLTEGYIQINGSYRT